MTRKQLAAVVAALIAIAGALGLGVNSQASASGASERVRALEVRQEEQDKRLQRMEGKIDRLLERSSGR